MPRQEEAGCDIMIDCFVQRFRVEGGGVEIMLAVDKVGQILESALPVALSLACCGEEIGVDGCDGYDLISERTWKMV